MLKVPAFTTQGSQAPWLRGVRMQYKESAPRRQSGVLACGCRHHRDGSGPLAVKVYVKVGRRGSAICHVLKASRGCTSLGRNFWVQVLRSTFLKSELNGLLPCAPAELRVIPFQLKITIGLSLCREKALARKNQNQTSLEPKNQRTFTLSWHHFLYFPSTSKPTGIESGVAAEETAQCIWLGLFIVKHLPHTTSSCRHHTQNYGASHQQVCFGYLLDD